MDETGPGADDRGDGGQQCADALVASRARILSAEADQLALAAMWADLHGAPDDSEAVIARLAASVLPGTERFRRAGVGQGRRRSVSSLSPSSACSWRVARWQPRD